MKTCWHNFELNSKFVGVKGAPWNANNTNQNTIIVCNKDTHKWTSFDFWGNNAYPEIEDSKMLLEAFACWLEDCNAGCFDFIEFVDCYGYTDLRHAKKIYDACVRSCRKWRRVSEMTEKETIYFLDELREENDI
ncbi:MAG: hypothetical protein IJA72_02530 [Clostridia bacterium]|nr:hypothetical protein [Clostridia bacterium]